MKMKMKQSGANPQKGRKRGKKLRTRNQGLLTREVRTPAWPGRSDSEIDGDSERTSDRGGVGSLGEEASCVLARSRAKWLAPLP